MIAERIAMHLHQLRDHKMCTYALVLGTLPQHVRLRIRISYVITARMHTHLLPTLPQQIGIARRRG